MELTAQTEQGDFGPNGKAEKLPAGKLHAAQYLIVLVLVVLITGLWRLEVLGADNFRALAEANRIRKVPVLAPRGRLFDREGRLLVDNYPSVSCYLLREQVKDTQRRSALDRAGAAHPRRSDSGHAPPLSDCA